MLIDALEKLSSARGASRLKADVSDSATDFFGLNPLAITTAASPIHSPLRNFAYFALFA